MPDRIIREHRPGHIGSTPQDTFAIVTGARIAGIEQDFDEHLTPRTRVDGYLLLPDVSQYAAPGYFRDDSQLIAMTASARRMQPDVMKPIPTPKTLGGFDPDDPNAY